MNTRYSAYDQINAGRQRRQASSLQDLEATIGGIEARLERMTPPAQSYSDEIADRMRKLSNDVSGLSRQRDTALRPPLREPQRPQQPDQQMMSVVNELQQLRSEIRRIEAKPQDDWSGALRKEIEAIKVSLGTLAREDTLRSVENRWSQFAEPRPVSIGDDPVIEALISRIDAIQHSVSGLPQSHTLNSLEEKVRVLASAIDQLSRRSHEINPEHLLQIEDRLDEISRAIVASSVSVQAVGNDKASFERIEARLAALNGRIDEILDNEPSQLMQDRIQQLAAQIDMMASRTGAPVEQMSRMGAQLETIASKLNQLESRNVDTDSIARSMEDRLLDIAARLEQTQLQSDKENRTVLSELENRLADISDRLSDSAAAQPDTSAPILAAVEQRFSDLSRQLMASQQEPAFDAGFAESIESRLSEITSRLNQSVAPMPGHDPAAIERLEKQVLALSRTLAEPRAMASGYDDIAPRLASIEQGLAQNQEAVLAAARQAAEDVLRNASFTAGSPSDTETVRLLANDLKSLDILARKSDERNVKTFEAIHDTLLKIVERLGSLETSGFGKSQPAAPVVTREFDDFQAPSMPKANVKLDLGVEAPSVETPLFNDDSVLEDFEPMPVRSPAEAAAAAASAAREMAGVASGGVEAKAKGGFLSGLTKVLRKEEKAPASELAGSSLPTAELEVKSPAPDTASGTPDLNAIMKRVRDERRGGSSVAGKGDDSAKSDFLAAARRAAQAAAADAEILKNKNAKASKAGAGGIAGLFQNQRKPILIGALAVMLALTGLQLFKAFNGSSPAPQVISQTETAPVETAPKSDALLPSATPDLQVTEKAATSSDSMAPVASEPQTQVRTVEAQPQKTSNPDVASQTADSSATGPVATETANVVAEPPTGPIMAPSEPALAEKPVAAVEVAAEVGPIALREAASSGDPKALFEVASRYTDGRGVTKDMAKAASYYQKAADSGFAPAQFRLGSLYEKGLGVERSADKAKTLYQLAAEQGNASAMHNLAVLFAQGAAGPVDNESAVRWFVKASELGIKDSQFNLGVFAAKGTGMPQSLEEAYKWFALVAKAGDKEAEKNRDDIANVMRPEQLKKARAAAELWKPKALSPEANAVDVPEAWTADTGQTASTPPPADMAKAIKNIQIILSQNGYDAGAPDGKMGDKTKKAIAAYQKANGMKATGEVDDALIKSLLKKVKS